MDEYREPVYQDVYNGSAHPQRREVLPTGGASSGGGFRVAGSRPQERNFNHRWNKRLLRGLKGKR